jgi:hypothetical protein
LVRKSIEHLIKLSKYKVEVWTLCRGIIILLKKTTCSSLKGTAKPEIILNKFVLSLMFTLREYQVIH